MLAVILAAGESRRFREGGLPVHKPFLTVDYEGFTGYMLEHVLRRLPHGMRALVGVPMGYTQHLTQQHRTTWAHWMESRCVSVTHTRGQADTLRQLLIPELVPPHEAVLVLNVDVLFATEDLERLVQTDWSGCSVSLLTQKSSSLAMSYVDRGEQFSRCVEKQVISDCAVAGAWLFPKLGPVRAALAEICGNPEHGEPYISHAVTAMPPVRWAEGVTVDPVDWGTPAALAASGARIV